MPADGEKRRARRGAPGPGDRPDGLRAPHDQGQAAHLSPWDAHLGDCLLLNKLLLWNQPHLLARYALTPDELPAWEGPYHAGVDPEG